MTENEKTFTQADIDELTAKHQEEMNAFETRIRNEYKRKAEKETKEALLKAQKEAEQANMSELEKANAQIAELSGKLKASEATIALTKQKDDARSYLKEIGVDVSNLGYVLVENDMEATKAKANEFKKMIDSVKKATFEQNAGSTIPKQGGSVVEDADLRKAFGLKD